MGELRWQIVDDGVGQLAFFDEVERHIGRGEYRGMEFLHVRARTIINSLPASSRMPFRHTINAYRGCSHACSYCFARPSHEYLNLDAGRDFERKIVVKINAVERLRAELDPRRWPGDPIAMGTNTDPYQRCEGKYHLTRGLVEVFAEYGNPFSILTKSTLILRDLDVLTEAGARTNVSTSLSIGTLDESVWKATEPGTPHPRQRIEAVAKLNDAGVPCGVLMGPVIPGLSDSADQIDDVVREAVAAGATSVAAVTLHLRPVVKELFMNWLTEHHPELVERFEALYPRSYAPRSVQDRIGRLVAESLARHGRPRPPRSHRGSPQPRQERSEPTGSQESLL